MARWVAGTATGRDWARVALGVDLVDGHCACVPLLLKTQASPLSPFPSSLVRPVSPSRAFDALWPSFHVMCGGTQVPRPCFFDRELGKLERGWGERGRGASLTASMPWTGLPCPSAFSCPHRVQSSGTSLQTPPKTSSARAGSPPLPSPLGPRARAEENREPGQLEPTLCDTVRDHACPGPSTSRLPQWD